MDTHALAWAAGFYDGEGSVWFKPPVRSGVGSVRISIQQCDREVLDRFQAAVGGVGKVVGPYVRKSPNASPFWAFQAHKKHEAMAVIYLLWKFLSTPKQEQAHRVLSLALPYHDLGT